ncbi:hypothetical protein SAY87_024688 [Trapa incisa]|uniref:Uncharacterized protein n=1 Tax=Trapa incisa TaxID=236973 RepID=A0AAN7JFY7_9MYRT|nr:hypothetical protein SAY87_024688 [Trapa incisa]
MNDHGDDDDTDSNGSSGSSSCQDQGFPDLNLELRISPPDSQYETDKSPKVVGEMKYCCFDCKLGLKNSGDCSYCSGVGSSGTTAATVDGSVVGYDFLNLKASASDRKI